MPRLRQSEKQQREEKFRRLVRKNMAMSGYQYMYSVADVLGINRDTLARKMKNPDEFSVAELRRLMQALNFPEDERMVLLCRTAI